MKISRAKLRQVRLVIATVLRDLVGLAGVAAALHGVALIYVPLAWLLGGAGTAGVVFLVSRQPNKGRPA